MMMSIAEKPQLRPYLGRTDNPRDLLHVYIVDRLGLAADALALNFQEFDCLDLFDGENTLADIQAATRQRRGVPLPLAWFADLARRLEANLFLDGPRFRRVVEATVRPPRCIGCYQGEPEALRRQLASLFTDPRGPSLPGRQGVDGGLRAALIPHMDYTRGGVTFAWGFKEVVEKTDAALFVIIGTSHYSGQRFTLTRKDFQTPLGVVPTDQDYIDRLVKNYGPGLFDDEWLAHLPEHAIELEVVFLQYLYENRRPIRIVPLVVGPFFDCVRERENPSNKADIARMVQALRRAAAETGEQICYIISGDLAHIGPKFGHANPVHAAQLGHSKEQDFALLNCLEKADTAGYFHIIAAEGDARNICGLPPTFTLLDALRPSRGKLLHYDRYVHPRGQESVSFASVGFYR